MAKIGAMTHCTVHRLDFGWMKCIQQKHWKIAVHFFNFVFVSMSSKKWSEKGSEKKGVRVIVKITFRPDVNVMKCAAEFTNWQMGKIDDRFLSDDKILMNFWKTTPIELTLIEHIESRCWAKIDVTKSIKHILRLSIEFHSPDTFWKWGECCHRYQRFNKT